MSTKTEIIALVQAAADTLDTPPILASMGTPGAYTKFPNLEQQKPTGQVWENPASPWQAYSEGLAAWLDSQGITEIGDIKSKLNELIGEYNKLLSDYNNGVVPSSASSVTPL